MKHILRREAGDEQERYSIAALVDRSLETDAVQIRHGDIGNDERDVLLVRLKCFQPLHPVGRRGNPKARQLQSALGDPPEAFLVIHQENVLTLGQATSSGTSRYHQTLRGNCSTHDAAGGIDLQPEFHGSEADRSGIGG